MRVSRLFLTLALAAALAIPAVGWSQETPGAKTPTRILKTETPVEGYEPVEFFDAMNAGQISVKLRMENAANAKFVIENTSDKALSIRMPEAFAAVPVMFQRGGQLAGAGGGGGGPGGGGAAGGQTQGAGGGFGGGLGGGGFGGGGGGMGGGGFGGGQFNIPAGKIGRVKVNTVCLDHGKEDPAPFRSYKVIPIEEYCADASVIETCKMLARGEISQSVAQATAWHFRNGLSFDQMLVMNRVEHIGGYFERFFEPGDLQIAFQLSGALKTREATPAAQPAPKSPGERSE